MCIISIPDFKEKEYVDMSFKLEGIMLYEHCHRIFHARLSKAFQLSSTIRGRSLHTSNQGAVSVLTATRSGGRRTSQRRLPGPASNG